MLMMVPQRRPANVKTAIATVNMSFFITAPFGRIPVKDLIIKNTGLSTFVKGKMRGSGGFGFFPDVAM
jgi:hypothetical protein